jgi:hypothetical protein
VIAFSSVGERRFMPYEGRNDMAARIGNGVQLGLPARGKDASSRPSRGRICERPGCQTVLSTYNSAILCFMHAAPTYAHPLSSR